MAIFWSSKGDRVKRLLVRRCSHSAQQRQREQLNAGLAVGHPKYPLECTLPSYRFHHVEARSCTRAKPELAAAVLTHLRRFVKPSLGGKAFKSEPPIVYRGRSRAGIVFDAGKSKVQEVPCLRNYGFAARSTPELPAFVHIASRLTRSIAASTPASRFSCSR
jgi:hypothetical protein